MTHAGHTPRRPLLRLIAVLCAAAMLFALPAAAQNKTGNGNGNGNGNAATSPNTAAPAQNQTDESTGDLEGPPVPTDRQTLVIADESLPTIDELTQRIEALKAVEQRTDQQNSELADLESAKAWLERYQQSITRTQSLQQDAQGAPQRLQTVQADRAATVDQPLPQNVRETPLAELESLLQQAKTKLETEKRLRDTVETDAVTRATRRKDIPNELATARARLEEINDTLSDPPPPDVPPAVAGAQRTALKAERVALGAKIAELEQELRSYDARVDLLTARRALAELRVQVAERQVNRLEQLATEKRAAAAEQARREAEQAARDARDQHPVLQEIAEQNSTLAAEKADVTEKISKLTARKQDVEASNQRWSSTFTKLRKLINDVGLNPAIGQRLRSVRSELQARTSGGAVRDRLKELNRVVIRGDELSDQQAMQLDLQQEARQRLREYGEPIDTDHYDQLLQKVQAGLAEQNEKYVAPLVQSYKTYEETLVAVNTIERQLAEEADRFNDFINERILWIQSTQPIGSKDVSNSWEALRWFVSAENWTNLLKGLWADVRSNFAIIGVCVLAVVLLLVMRRRLVARLIDAGEQARSVFKAQFSNTVVAVGLTILIALPWPLLLLIVGWRLTVVAGSVPFAEAIGQATLKIAAPLFVALFLWHVCRTKGLGSAHFRWQLASLRRLRAVIRTIVPIALPLLFLVTALDNQPMSARSDSLGRLAFIAQMVIVAIALRWLLSPKTGILRGVIESNPNGWLARLRAVWFPLLVLMPFALAIVAALGYYYTAQQLQLRVIYMGRLIVVVLVVYALLQRWLHLVQRRVAIAEATRQAQAQSEATPTDASDESKPPLEPHMLDVAALSSQTVKLLRTALFASVLIGVLVIWADVFPAFGMLREVTLWSEATPTAVSDAPADSAGPLDILNNSAGENGSSNGTSADTDTGAGASPQQQAEPARVTLADLVYALFILAITIIIARDVPGLLEFVVLQRLPITYGARYAVTTVTRYAIVIIGVVLSFNAIGIGWSKVQFLAAAITVGLGFGLQEIFANFVSGLIILFERPIRVGDTVTVGQISGTVSRIRMRATTITDWDRKELIIPNKEFVTGQIVNWSLTDSVLRLRIAVGIAYGSDTVRAKEALLRVAQECEFVIEDPPPRAVFLGFGDNSLNFELRAFIGTIDNYLTTIDALHKAIDDAFRKEKITIAFPQRDLHIVSYPPELAGISRAGDAPKELPDKSDE